jgi:hypothetical protein
MLNSTKLILLTGLLIVGCATKPKVESWQLSQGVPDKALLIMDITLDAKGLMSKDHECKIRARYENGTEISFIIRPGKRRYFWSVPEGSYEVKHMTCGLFTEFDMSRFASFRVKNGNSYYFGQTDLALENKSSLKWSQNVLGRDELLVQYLSLPNSLKTRLYSPYSRKKVLETQIRKTLIEPKVIVEGASNLAAILQKDWPLRDCQQEEKKRNPLWAGVYKLEVLAKEGVKVVETNDTSKHLYTDQFQNCVKKTLSTWLGSVDSNDFKMEVHL